MDRAGLSGDDGPTHHGLFDIGYLRHIPNWVHMQPKDEDEFVDMLWTMAHYNSGPIAVRYPRGPGTGAQINPNQTSRDWQSGSRATRARRGDLRAWATCSRLPKKPARKLEEKEFPLR
jgi:deoxyxylulose-5-phosphate synthase